MPDLDLERRLHGVDGAKMPDLWSAARDRAEHDGPWTPNLESPGRRRLVAAATALALAAAATGVLVWSFRDTRAGRPGGAPENGPIVTVGRGPDSLPGVDNTDLFAVDPATGARWNLTNTPEAESDPFWSSDGTHVAFIRTTTTDGGTTFSSGVFAKDVSTGTTSEIYPCADEHCDIRSMAWSPDNRSLAIVDTHPRPGNGTIRFTSSGRLVVIDLADGHRTTLCAGGSCVLGLGSIAWSPDGTRIAFAGFPFVITGPGGPEPSSVWVANVDGSNLRRITEGDACRAQGDPCFSDHGVAWSPDGSRIAFVRESSEFGSAGALPPAPEVVVVAPDGGTEHVVPVCDEQVELCQPAEPIWSADGSEVVTAIGYHPRTVIRVNVATGQATTLAAIAHGPCVFEGAQLSWSPDHRSIAYEGGPRGNNVCVIPPAGGDPRVLVHDFASDVYADFSWIPAGVLTMPASTAPPGPSPAIAFAPLPVGTLVFASTNGRRPDGPAGSGIWSVAADDPAPRLVTDAVPSARQPDLSRDGRRIVFAGDADRRLQVWSIGMDGSDLRQLTDYPWGADDPAWSPDGSLIAFTVEFGKGQTQGLYVMNADGTDQRLLWAGQAFDPTWTHDGAGITIDAEEGGASLVETVDAANGQVAVVPVPGGTSWSPDGARIAFWWNTVAGSGLYLANADGSNLTRVPLPAMDGDGSIAWSPDGQWLAFQGDAPGSGEQIYVVHPDGTDLHQVTEMAAGPATTGPNGAPGRTQDPSWGPTT